jgi:hypothetical protein
MNTTGILLLSSANQQCYYSLHSMRRDILAGGGHFIDYSATYLKYGKKQTERYIMDYVKANGIQILFYCSTEPWIYEFSVDFFKDIGKKAAVVMLFTDCDYYFEQRDRYYGQAADMVLAMDSISPHKFKQFGIPALTFYPLHDSADYNRLPSVEKSIDVSFVGLLNSKIGRPAYCDYLKSHNINIEVYGSLDTERVSQKQMVELFNKSRINLNFAGGGERTAFAIQRRIKQFKGRILEVTLSGGFLLSEYTPGIEDLFDIGGEIDVFRTKEELLDKVNYYLGNPSLRKSMASRSYERAQKYHSEQNGFPRLVQILRDVKPLKNKEQIYLDDIFIKKYASFRFLYMIRFLKRWKLARALEELVEAFRYNKFQWIQIREYIIQETIDKFPKIKSLLKSLFRIRAKPLNRYYM